MTTSRTINAAIYDAATGRIVQLTVGAEDVIARSSEARGMAYAAVPAEALYLRFYGATHCIVDGAAVRRPQADIDAELTPVLLGEIRAQRDRLLADTDWTALRTDWPEELRAEWTAYRQALRDLMDGLTDPSAVEWPVPPATRPAA